MIPHQTVEQASSRLRVFKLVPFLEKHFAVHVHVPYKARHEGEKDFFYQIKKLADMVAIIYKSIAYDAVYAQKIENLNLLRLVKLFNQNLFYDYDDAIYTSITPEKRSRGREKRKELRVTKILSLARCVLAGNDHLAHYARKRNKNVTTMRTLIDVESIPIKNTFSNKNPFLIGWMGNTDNFRYLIPLQEIFRDTCDMFPQVVFKVVTGSLVTFKSKVRFCYQKWDLEKEYDELMSFDIGIAPLADDEWTRGKQNFKAIQYMAAGIPTVASRVGMDTKLFKDGEDILFADSDTEWREKITRLVESEDLRKQLGRNGRNKVAGHYSIRKNIDKIIYTIKNNIKI
jgi:glycosyltransferase involved in cell wall biosynthesis